MPEYIAIPQKYTHGALRRLAGDVHGRAEHHRPTYAVWSPTDGPPRRLHDNEEEARTAAEEMAREHPGRQFIVIRFCSISVVEQPAITRRMPSDPDGLPF